MRRGAWLSVWLAIGCGGADARDDGVADGWHELVAAEWTVPPGREKFVCALATVPADTDIAAFRTVAPPGTHHALVTVTEPVAPDGVFECDPGALSDAMVFASGIATSDLILPEGVAMRVAAGKQVLLNLHLLNTTDALLHGRSAVVVRDAPRGAALAEMVFAGTVDIALPPGADAVASGSCTFHEDATLFEVWPHMHAFGTRMTVVHRSAGGAHTLHDGPYDVREQRHYPVGPVRVPRGDRVDVTCHWKNTSAVTIHYGNHAADEMCFAGLYRYPAAGAGLFCDAS